MEARTRIWMLLVLWACCLPLGTAWAQWQALWSGARLLAEHPANLFAHWQGKAPFYGALLEIPSDWSVVQAWVLRPSFTPLALHIDALEPGRVLLLPTQPLNSPLMLCIQTTPGSPGLVFWQLTPLEPSDSRPQNLVPNLKGLQQQPLLVQPASTENPRNYVLAVRRDAQPLSVTDTLLRKLDLQHPFTLALWLKSTDRDAVVLSTWPGDEQQPYPLELVLDAAGFLRAYRGRPQLHQVLITPRPVADGSWHHIALTYDPASGWSRLYLDGQGADSLFAPDSTPIDPPKVLVLGGRPKQPQAAFEGFLDMIVLDRSAWSATQIRRYCRQADPPVEGLRLDFEADRLRLPSGLRRRRADLFFFEPLQHLQILSTENEHVLLSWTCTDQQTRRFVVERSINGRDFTVIARVPAGCEGLPTTFRDLPPPEAPVLYYRIQQELEGGLLYPSAVLKLGRAPVQPAQALLIGNFPNPFQDRTTIQYELHQTLPVRLAIWDLSGHEVRVLVDAVQAAGPYTIPFNAADLPSGTYFLRLETPEGVQTHKMILIR